MEDLILAGHQPEYLPYTGFFHKMMLADEFVIVDHVQYHKKSWQNRNRIRSRDGEVLLTVPVLSKGSFDQPINEVKINNQEKWRRKHWQTIMLNYKKAPFFDEHATFFEGLYGREWENLAEFNETIIRYIAGQLGIDKKLSKSSEFNASGSKTELLIDMCKKRGYKSYLSGSGGRGYVDQNRFKEEHLVSLYTDFLHPEYPQQAEPFLPNLSVIDMLFNCGAQKSAEMIKSSGGYKS
ncbi:MAG: WbqC family protein [Candidatus Margulisiibacteriota bacterium]